MATSEFLTINLTDALVLKEISGPIGRYFSKIYEYLVKETAAISVQIYLPEVAGYNKSWDAAIANKLILSDLVRQADARELAAKAANSDEYDERYMEEFSSVGYL